MGKYVFWRDTHARSTKDRPAADGVDQKHVLAVQVDVLEIQNF